jgi:hypothetical protein
MEEANARVMAEATKSLDALQSKLELKELQVDDILKGIDLAADATLPTLLLVGLTLTACAVSQPSSSVPIDLPPLPAKLVSVSCVPTTLPNRR